MWEKKINSKKELFAHTGSRKIPLYRRIYTRSHEILLSSELVRNQMTNRFCITDGSNIGRKKKITQTHLISGHVDGKKNEWEKKNTVVRKQRLICDE